MASHHSLTARLDELRSRNPGRLHSENTTGHNTPSFRYSGSFMSPPKSQTPTETPNLQRRFTTDLSKMQAQGVGAVGQPSSSNGPAEHPNSMFKKAQLLEKKKQEYELAAEQRKQFQAQLQYYTQQEAKEKEEMEQITRDLQRAGLVPPNYERNFVSEPSTPPERENSFSSVFSRSNRYSASSFTSPPANTRSSRSNSQITSPPSAIGTIPEPQLHGSEPFPSRSVPSSRRGSTDRVTAFVPETNGSVRRSGLSSNRYSMPVTGARGRAYDPVPEHSPSMDMEHLNTTSFLFDEDEKLKENLTSPELAKYLQMNDNNFPVLLRNHEQSGTLSASSAALDLALSQPAVSGDRVDTQTSPGHRWSLQHSLQSNNPIQGGLGSSGGHMIEQQTSTHQPNRHSMGASSAALPQVQASTRASTSESTRPTLTNSHPSYSTNDVPTLRSANPPTNTTPPKQFAHQPHGHNSGLGRVPQKAFGDRHSRDVSVHSETSRDGSPSIYQPLNAALQTNPSAFTTPVTASSPTDVQSAASGSFNGPFNLNNQAFYAGYGMHLMSMGLNPMVNPVAFQNQMQLLQQQGNFLPYTNYAQQSRFQDGHPRSMQTRRAGNVDDQTRFNNVKLESLQGEILALCKDQHGCRYLQKKLEDRSAPGNVNLIFLEVHQHVVELMTDPFGNYLCQKLLEFVNDEQRTFLVNNAAPEMVKIALNSHGTRALQKMIEFISTPEQIQAIIQALNDRVVDLIKDLNGNHVIQKCLNHLSSADAQFIFNAVGAECVAVGTHRHGCCVLQRCIDHASGPQKAQLINQITEHAFHLVQDPFGNYVLQYIVDLQEPCFTDPLCLAFRTQIPQLSKQKFSSNVIEKCLRGADSAVTRLMIEEMFNPNELDRMLRDSYANYVVQTAMDYADAETKARLIDAIRPLLPAVRNTPHGRRISTKIMAIDGQAGRYSINGTSNERATGQISLSLQMSPQQSPPGQVTPMNSLPNQMPSGFPSVFPPQYAQHSPNTNSNIANAQNLSNFDPGNFSPVQQPAPFARTPQVQNGGFF